MLGVCIEGIIMKLKLIACKALSRELSYLSALSDNIIDITYIRQGYHEKPNELRNKLQQEIDLIESGEDPHTNQSSSENENGSASYLEGFDAIILGYGLCSNGIVGISSKEYPIVVPRGHDCMTLLLGSKERYMKYFKELPGCFWYSGSWIESSQMPCELYDSNQKKFWLSKGYDDDVVDYCLQEFSGWTKKYKYAAYVKMPFIDKERWSKFTEEAAAYYNWEYKTVNGDMSLLTRLLEGQWNKEDFLVVPPGHKIAATNDEYIIRYE